VIRKKKKKETIGRPPLAPLAASIDFGFESAPPPEAGNL
jgi:hypothetical protein